MSGKALVALIAAVAATLGLGSGAASAGPRLAQADRDVARGAQGAAVDQPRQAAERDAAVRPRVLRI